METTLLGRQCRLNNSEVAGTIVLVYMSDVNPYVGIEFPNGHVVTVSLLRIVLLNNFNAVG